MVWGRLLNVLWFAKFIGWDLPHPNSHRIRKREITKTLTHKAAKKSTPFHYWDLIDISPIVKKKYSLYHLYITFYDRYKEPGSSDHPWIRVWLKLLPEVWSVFENATNVQRPTRISKVLLKVDNLLRFYSRYTFSHIEYCIEYFIILSNIAG